jgi:hypothetical protein
MRARNSTLAIKIEPGPGAGICTASMQAAAGSLRQAQISA